MITQILSRWRSSSREGKIDNANPTESKKNKKGSIIVNLVGADPDPSTPNPVSIMLANNLLVPAAGFTGDTFDIVVTLSEEPKEGKFTKDHLDVDKGTASDGVFLRAMAAIDGPDTGTDDDPTTGRSSKHYQYLVTITPKAEDGDLVIKFKSFEDQEKPTPNKYTPPTNDITLVETGNKLTVKIKKKSDKPLAAGFVVNITNKRHIPKDGYLVVATDPALATIHKPTDTDADNKPPLDHQRTPAERLYNVIDVDLPDLETFLTNGGTIDLVAPENVVISEIMWGSDASLDTNTHSQWIEIKNKSGKLLPTGDKNYQLIFYGPNETVPPKTAAVAATATTPAKPAALPGNVKDRVGTITDTDVYWSIASKGQSGRSGHGETKADLTAVVPTRELISMYRVSAIGADGLMHPVDGNTEAAWLQSGRPSLNIDGANRIGSPGAAPSTAFALPPTPPKTDPPVVIPAATATDIMITEIMVDTGNGRLPQWIELTNVSGAEKSLADWSVMVQNSDDDDDVIGATISIELSGTLGVGGGTGAGGTMGKTLVLVGGSARTSSNLSGSDRVMDISEDVGGKGRYQFISDMAFMVALVPPQTTGVLTYGDVAGNLDAATSWDIPMSENGRSSLIRREMDAAGMATMGTDANGWILASATPLVISDATWIGSDEDAGTPGVDSGGPLPVELSHFRPARDKATGAVVITWSTQSELNNAGFFIKRSQQRNGEFKVINATMVSGAGTTSEKQFYTYTDTTAQPNVVYYYQIEDVSLDGNRQTLTLGTRLKGHIGAAGKLTSTWGELKSSNE